MDYGIDREKLLMYKAAAIKLLSDPLKMRLAVVLLAAALGIGAVYMPLSDQIDQGRAAAASERKRLAAIQEVEALHRDANDFRSRIGLHSDTNEWVQFLLAGSRQMQVRLRDMESKEPQKVGPYKAVTLVLEMEGTYAQLRAFVEWLEQSDRLVRVDMVWFEKRPGSLVMKICMLGLVRGNA